MCGLSNYCFSVCFAMALICSNDSKTLNITEVDSLAGPKQLTGAWKARVMPQPIGRVHPNSKIPSLALWKCITVPNLN